ncbi:hypothetical protein A3C59_03335 [Candidatus Daviesbacteria bacterium RIFCSPHIGHO2_02_FULL_36_13]|uniref:Uncharacterized protein n=1 Tax=Candidatus Daviesbacteria bacterium RIFCSPHIGHO2_02_FULL_36_13 TaxID=1797768 RepID=A0A1F5JPY3_9BACT|nr:MAG: hypothetical protein A3C59_03335 [Candidatus Daviesbacteria bacterium RIFCSPHIGHO2_02_FULL_36_13]OGE42817.1 MAG: hypothetical protein A3A45_03555 [Candidatus Daviesbacteria bacterium RIFCSPLOWO2_01_FULL_36_8]
MDNNPASSNLSQLAIDAALDSRWGEALKYNKQIIKLDPQNVDALNRQARVYMEMGKFNLSKKYYGEVIRIDPYNPIAQKNLKIIKSFKPNGQNGLAHNVFSKLSPTLFLQEPGKTKIVNLLKVCEPQKLSKAFCGMKVNMIIKNRRITIVDEGGSYLGVLPDDVNYSLLRLIKGGNKFDLFVKSIRVNSLAVLIKETYRSKRFKNQPSFLENSNATLTTDILTSLDQDDSDGEPEDGEEEQTV